MLTLGNQHCASCIGTLSFPTARARECCEYEVFHIKHFNLFRSFWNISKPPKTHKYLVFYYFFIIFRFAATFVTNA